MKNKHTAVIKAWGAGAKIQYRDLDISSEWKDVDMPLFCDDREYRVKPQKKQLWARPYRNIYGDFVAWSRNNLWINARGTAYIGPSVLVWEEGID